LPTLSDPNLTVRAVISGLDQPTSMAFIGANEFLVLEKATGRVKHVINGALAQIVLDLSVNNASERGLPRHALHPQFTAKPFSSICTGPALRCTVPPHSRSRNDLSTAPRATGSGRD
jgi:glucose/arabinose dehydrogenase